MSLAMLFMAVLPSCSIKKHLDEGEYLVHKNKIKVEQNKGIDEALPNKEVLQDIPFQQPNRRFLGVWALRAWFQRDVRNEEDIVKRKNLRSWIQRSIGEVCFYQSAR